MAMVKVETQMSTHTYTHIPSVIIMTRVKLITLKYHFLQYENISIVVGKIIEHKAIRITRYAMSFAICLLYITIAFRFVSDRFNYKK